MLHANIACLFWSVLVSLVTARAPEDADPFCAREEFAPPMFPPNTRVLMDSFNYINLLPPQDGAVWQQVDNDGNNVVGAGTEVSQLTQLFMIKILIISLPVVSE